MKNDLYKDLYNKLPDNWQGLKLKDYIKLAPVINDSDKEADIVDEDIYTSKVVSDLDKNIQVISLLADVPVDDIEALTMVQLNELINKLSFMGTAPEKVKTSIKYKSFDQLTYDGFITFDKLNKDFSDEGILGNSIENLPAMLSVFSADNLPEDHFLNLSMPEVITGFFTVSKNIQKYLKRLERSLYLSLMKTNLQQGKKILMQYWQKDNPLKKSLTKNGIIG